MKGPAAQGGGEIVPVDGGHILRSTGKKDRHSKVYTAKGPRDRRVRLSAHTAIQFYDVQDRLGYDRPSKAVDWLIKKAKAAIDNLNEPPPPPPWQQPAHTPTPESNPSSSDLALDQQSQSVCEYDFQSNNTSSNSNRNNNNNPRCGNSAFLVAAAGEAGLMNTMKSLFPTSGFGGFDNDPCQGSSFQPDDLGLSLQTFQADSQANSNMPFHGSFHRIDGWNGGGGGGGGIFSQGLSFAQRELLQSNATANLWNQRPLISANHHDHNDDDNPPQPRSGYKLGFRVPTRIYGEEEAAENHR